MNKYLSSSLISKSLDSLYQYFITSYSFKVLSVLLNWCKHSKTNKLIGHYLSRNSSLKYSATYRICSKVFSSIDMVWDKLYGVAINCYKNSITVFFIKKAFCSTNSYTAYSIFILFFSCGFGVASILIGNFNKISALLLVLGILMSTLLLVEKSKWLACIKGSLFCRIALYVFD